MFATKEALDDYLDQTYEPETEAIVREMLLAGVVALFPADSKTPGLERLAEVKCPTCVGFIPNNRLPGAYSGAQSRNLGVEICSTCGTNEALADYYNSLDKVLGKWEGEKKGE
jgi:hypothetical protein